MRKRKLLFAVLFILAMSLGCSSEKTSVAEEGNTLALTVVNPPPGEMSTREIPKDEDAIRQTFGMPTVEEERAARTYAVASAVLEMKEVECMYVARFNARGYLDPRGELWNGIAYDGGIYPVLERLPNGLVKAVERRSDTPEDAFDIVYFRAVDLAVRPQDTDLYREIGKYEADSSIPELCRERRGEHIRL